MARAPVNKTGGGHHFVFLRQLTLVLALAFFLPILARPGRCCRGVPGQNLLSRAVDLGWMDADFGLERPRRRTMGVEGDGRGAECKRDTELHVHEMVGTIEG